MVTIPLPTNPVWWGSMHAILSYLGNRSTTKHTDRTDYNTLRRSLARSVISACGALRMLDTVKICCFRGCVQHDGLTEEEGWYLEQIKVSSTLRGRDKSWLFVCQNWLSLHEGDCQTRRQLYPQQSSKTGSSEIHIFKNSRLREFFCRGVRLVT